MSISVSPMYQTGEEMQRLPQAFQDRVGIKTTEVATVFSAGQDLHCFERSVTSGKLAGTAASVPMVNLECVPLSDKHFFSASYDGTRDLAPEFYDVLKGVRRLEK